MDLAAIRAELNVTRRMAYFQTGSLGPAPRAAVRAAQQDLERLNDHGPAYLPALKPLVERVEAARAALAGWLGCSPDELGFTQNTSQSIAVVGRALNWRPGDQVIISDLEHPANVLPWQVLGEQAGVELITVPFGPGLAQRVAAAITPRTRLISLCQVSPRTGAVLPVQPICALAASRGVATLVDGAQAVGVMPVDLRALGCDYYVGSGHKWLLGLPGVGYLYVRRERLPEFRPHGLGAGAGEYVDGRVRWHEPARKIEGGTVDMAVQAALNESLAFVAAIGSEFIRQRVRTLAARLREELQRVPGVEVLTPPGPAGDAGITTFRLVIARHEALIDYLSESHQVLVKLTVPTRDSIRVSTHFFNTEDEIGRLIAGLRQFVTM